mmetsp:Transcript_9269/g.14012  ORF Transcript_9269/g.14012 Transcript_9269/m.14012 type:complete len:301 (-) Transcript_9269:262-1164(-)
MSDPVSQQMDRGFTNDQLEKEKFAKDFQWNARSVPPQFDPVQLDISSTPLRCLDWWNTRSQLFCCCFSCATCLSGHKTIDGTDPEVWKKQLENPNPGTPESMQGVWWLKYNIAHEQLVTLFGDANLVGTFNEEGTDGYGMWYRPLETNWSRERSCFGYILGWNGKRTQRSISGRMNLKDGILTLHTGKGKGNQLIYKITDNEWWKVHYLANPGEPGEQEIDFMYKWLKVIDKDGNTTEFWDDYVAQSNGPLPHRNCGTSWLPCWPICLSKKQVNANMIVPNKKQIVSFKKHDDKITAQTD